MAKLIDGKLVSSKIRLEISQETAEFIQKTGIEPHLVVIIVGNDAASMTYVKNKKKACEDVGFKSTVIELPEETSEFELLEQIKELNESNIDVFLEEGYTYEASFVFTYIDENNNEININIANDVYKNNESLKTRIFLRVMVTLVPISIALLSYYIQNYKFIVNEEYYDQMIKEINERKK